MEFNPLGWLLRVYIDALVKGNPFAVLLAVAFAVAISVGPFYGGLKERDPVAITMVCVFGALILLALSIVVYDKRKTQAEQRKKAARSGRPGPRQSLTSRPNGR